MCGFTARCPCGRFERRLGVVAVTDFAAIKQAVIKACRAFGISPVTSALFSGGVPVSRFYFVFIQHSALHFPRLVHSCLERHHRVHLRGAAGGEPAGEQGDGREKHRASEGERVERRYFVEKNHAQTGVSTGAPASPERQAERDERQSLPHHEAENISNPRAPKAMRTPNSRVRWLTEAGRDTADSERGEQQRHARRNRRSRATRPFVGARACQFLLLCHGGNVEDRHIRIERLDQSAQRGDDRGYGSTAVRTERVKALAAICASGRNIMGRGASCTWCDATSRGPRRRFPGGARSERALVEMFANGILSWPKPLSEGVVDVATIWRPVAAHQTPRNLFP